MFFHFLRSKRRIGGVENDRLWKFSKINCLAGLHRGFIGSPTRGPKRCIRSLSSKAFEIFKNLLKVFRWDVAIFLPFVSLQLRRKILLAESKGSGEGSPCAPLPLSGARPRDLKIGFWKSWIFCTMEPGYFIASISMWNMDIDVSHRYRCFTSISMFHRKRRIHEIYR